MKKYIVMSVVTAFVVSSVAAANVDYDAKIAKLEKELKKLKKTVSSVKAHDAKDNIKWHVDFRTSHDTIAYTSASGREMKNNSLFSNRLWLDMAYAPTANMVFRGRLSYNKAYGASASNKATGFPQRGFSYDTFDWVLNENLTDDTLRVKEAYWLYMSDSFLGTDIDWTASFGRRPSTNGFLVSLREDDKPHSPLGHVINMEFDGASFKFGLEKLTGISGMYWKACLGRGLSNARARFNFDGGFASEGDYAKDPSTLKDINLAGFIFVPYNDGQYEVITSAYRGFNVPGFTMADLSTMKPDSAISLQTMGDMDGAAVSFLVDGIGEDLGDFADDVKLFASYGISVTHPNNEIAQAMLGSNDDKTGTSYWVGAQWPCLLTDDAVVGAEYNHGSKYWRPFTYGEDTLVGSKLATRGDAFEVYWTKQLSDVFSLQARYTHIQYDYTGSQGFFGQGGTPMSMDEAQQSGLDPIKEAQDIRVYLRYRF